MLEQAAEQQPAHLLHGVLEGEGDGGDQVVLLAAPLDLAQEVLRGIDRTFRPQSKTLWPYGGGRGS